MRKTRTLAASRTTILATVLCLACAGCQGLNLFSPTQKTNDPLVKDPRSQSALTKPGRHTLRIAPYVFQADYDLKQDQELFRELAGLRDQVYRELALPSSDRPVFVYLFEDRERYERYMQARYPELPRRRAFFIAQPRAIGGEDLLVFTFRGDRIQQDLRHELTHALLHSVLKGVPLWLDEGLAEFFELPSRNNGVNDSHLNQIRRSVVEPFKPDLARLEKLVQVKDMTPAEYREAWAWTHYFLRGSNQAKTALLGYLQQLRANAEPGLLRPRLAQLIPAPEEALRQHLAGVEFAQRFTPTVQR
jgi:hypothetical protein